MILEQNDNIGTVLISDVGTDSSRNSIFTEIAKQLELERYRVFGVFKGLGFLDGDARRKVGFQSLCLENLIGNTQSLSKKEIIALEKIKTTRIVQEAYLLEQQRTNRQLPDFKETLALYYLKMQQILYVHKPVACFMWHQFNSFHSILSHLCKEFKVERYYLEHGLLPGSLNIEHNGQMALSEICTNADNFNTLSVDEDEVLSAKLYTQTVVTDKLNRKPHGTSLTHYLANKKIKLGTKTVVFYAGQNDPKTGILPRCSSDSLTHSPFYSSTFDGLEDIAKHCKELDIIVLYKPHPSVGRYEQLNNFDYRNNPHVIFIPESVDFLDCLNAATICATIVSTGAYQALFRDIPTIVMGNMPLSQSGAVYQLNARDDLKPLLVESVVGVLREEQKIALHEHVARLAKYAVWAETDDSLNYFKRTIAEFVEELKEATDENRTSQQCLIRFQFDQRTTFFPYTSPYFSTFINKYTPKITEVGVTSPDQQDFITECIGVDTSRVIQDTRKIKHRRLVLIGKSKKVLFQASLLKEQFSDLIEVSFENSQIEEIETILRNGDEQSTHYLFLLAFDYLEQIETAYKLARSFNAPLIGFVQGFYSRNASYYDLSENRWINNREKLHLLDYVVVPGENDLIRQLDTKVIFIGCLFNFNFLSLKQSGCLSNPLKRKKNEVVVISDFSQYGIFDTDLSKRKVEWRGLVEKAFQSTDFNVRYINPDHRDPNYLGLLGVINNAYMVITPFSDLYFYARSLGKIALVFDPKSSFAFDFGRSLILDQSDALLDFHRTKKPHVLSSVVSGGYIKKAENLKNYLSIVNKHLNTFLPLNDNILIANGKEAFTNFTEFHQRISDESFEQVEHGAVAESKGRVAMFSIMPDRGYSGGRYHALVLAEGIASCGYKVDLFTNNKPYFFDDFDIYDQHNDIDLHLISSFDDTPQFGSYGIDFVIVVPDLSQKPNMYKTAINLAHEKNCHLVMLNFESPNWFNSMVALERNEELWSTWNQTSRFASVILSTTKESVKFAEEFYVEKSEICEHKHLYAAINSVEADVVSSLHKKEKRVIFFLPRANLSEHKGWKSICKMFGPAFNNHTLVLLCAQSSLDKAFTRELKHAAELYGFNIEYKVKLNDRQKFNEIARACLMVFPSEFEGYGYPPVEALYVGTPCIAFDIPVLRETCQDHLIYSPVGDWEHLRENVNNALKKQYRLTQEAIDLAKSFSSFGAFKKNINNLFRDLKARPTLWDTTLSSPIDFTNSVSTTFFKTNKSSATALANATNLDGTFKQIYKNAVSHGLKQSICNEPRGLVLFSLQSQNKTVLKANYLNYFFHMLGQVEGKYDCICDATNTTNALKFKKSISSRVFPIGSYNKSQFRDDAALFLNLLNSQYQYKTIIIVDDFLLYELAHVELDKETKIAKLNTNTGQFDISPRSSNSHTSITVPNMLLRSLERKDWFSASGNANSIGVYVDISINNDAMWSRVNEYLELVLNSPLNLKVVLFGISAQILMDYRSESRITSTGDEDLHLYISNLRKCVGWASFVGTNGCTTTKTYFSELATLISILPLKGIPTDLIRIEKLLGDKTFWLRERRNNFNEYITSRANCQSYDEFKQHLTIYHEGNKRRNLYISEYKDYIDNDKILKSELHASHEFLNKRVKDSISKGDLSAACTYLKRVIAADANNPMAYYFYVNLLILRGDAETAISELDMVIGFFPMEQSFYYLRSKLINNSNDTTMLILSILDAFCVTDSDDIDAKGLLYVLEKSYSRYTAFCNNLLEGRKH